MRMRIIALIAIGALCAASGGAWSASLDLSAAYKIDAADYANLNLTSHGSNNASFLANDAKLGFAVNQIDLGSAGGGEQSMDVDLLLHALGAPGLNASPAAPFDRVAANYPNADFSPFLENALIRIHHLFNTPVQATFGRQSFKLGSGLLLDDDGAGLTGVTLQSPLPWGFQTEFFLFKTDIFGTGSSSAPASGYFSPAGGNNLDLFGLTLSFATDGLWQINELVEHDPGAEIVPGCEAGGAGGPAACTVARSLRSFTSMHYSINVGPMFFDGEGALEKGYGYDATDAAGNNLGRVAYDGNAEVIRAKWKQPLYRVGEGIARLTVAHGSGYNPSGSTTDTAFFPSHGHQFNGLERDGFGEFFGATPYSAFGGSYAAGTPSGLPVNVSGIDAVGAGYTPPAYRGVAMDLDYYLFQADRSATGSRTLGNEWDIGFRYDLLNTYDLSLVYALFRIGPALNPGGGTAHKIAFEASGRF
ncbi:MAG: hypothetical protein ACYCPQ_08950 [Elusimicrobiota bacterium]